MTICIESQLLNHHQRSGLLTYTEGLVNSLQRNDKNNVYDLLFYSLWRQAKDMPGPTSENFRKIVLRVPDRTFKGRQSLIDNLFLPPFLKHKKVRIFHRPSGYTMPTLKGIFKILTVHDLRTLTIGDNFLKQNIENYRKTLRAVDCCIAVSECTKRDLMNHFQLEEQKIRVVYLGADERFRPAPLEKVRLLREKYNIHEPFFLSLGSVDRKNIDGIIKGFAKSIVKSKCLLILGINWDIDKYKNLIESLDITDRIRILPGLTDDEVVSLYSDCICFLFPSHYEGFGLPILEAMQCGAPVITSNVSSCPEVAGDAAIIVAPNNISQISDAINQIYNNPSFRMDFIRKGYSRAANFSWDKFGKEMMSVYSLAEKIL